MPLDVALKVDSKIFRGWTGLRAQRGIEQCSGAFSVQLTEKFPGQPQRWEIEPGASCVLSLDESPVITGFVDSSERGYDAGSHEISVVGRDAAGDVVDCSVFFNNEKLGNIQGQSLLGIVKLLVKPFGLSVRDEVKAGAMKLQGWAIEPGESVWDNIERAARLHAVMIMSDGNGGLVITRAGTGGNPTALIEGENVLSASFCRDDSNRFSKYIIKGQTSNAGSEFITTAEFDNHQSAEILDSTIKRYRPYLIDIDDLTAGVSLKDRGLWERNVRRGKSRRISVTVQGWSAKDRIWQPNEMVPVKLPTLGVEARLLIVSVTYLLDNQGSRTELLLSPREAYDLIPESEQNKSNVNVPADILEKLK